MIQTNDSIQEELIKKYRELKSLLQDINYKNHHTKITQVMDDINLIEHRIKNRRIK